MSKALRCGRYLSAYDALSISSQLNMQLYFLFSQILLSNPFAKVYNEAVKTQEASL